MFNTLSWQTVTKRQNYIKAVLVYKALNNLLQQISQTSLLLYHNLIIAYLDLRLAAL